MAVISDPIADFLIRFKNATRAEKETFSAPYSKIKEEIARILKEEGYLNSYEAQGEGVEKVIVGTPKYLDRTPALTDLKRVSRPGLRQFAGSQEIPRVLGGMGITIVSTSRGIMAGHKARKENIGGEVLAMVW
jgi:small subunit ribosomal protein S8